MGDVWTLTYLHGKTKQNEPQFFSLSSEETKAEIGSECQEARCPTSCFPQTCHLQWRKAPHAQPHCLSVSHRPPVQFNITQRTQGWWGLWQTDSGWLSFSLSLTRTKPPVMSGQIKGRILWQWATLLRLVCHAVEWSCGKGKVWPRSSHPLPGHTQLHPHSQLLYKEKEKKQAFPVTVCDLYCNYKSLFDSLVYNWKNPKGTLYCWEVDLMQSYHDNSQRV